MTDSPSWYDAQMDADAMLGPDFAERKSEGPRVLHPSPRYDVGALMDAIVEGRPYSLIPMRAMSLNASFNEIVQQHYARKEAA